MCRVLAGVVRWKCFCGILPSTRDRGRSTGVVVGAVVAAVVGLVPVVTTMRPSSVSKE